MENQEVLKLNGTQELLAYAHDLDLLEITCPHRCYPHLIVVVGFDNLTTSHRKN
jgi:hypothetical protein